MTQPFTPGQDDENSAYNQGRRDQENGTVDTTRTADRDYVGGLADQRTAQTDAALTAGDPDSAHRPGRS